MSRPARWGHTTGRLYRQAAALSGKEIRACVRIAAGSVPRNVIPVGVCFRLACREPSCTSLKRLRPPPYRGANAPILSHFACGGPSLGHPQSGDRSSSSRPRELTGRQPLNQSLQHAVEPLKFTHQPHLQIASRRPSLAGTGPRDLRRSTEPPLIANIIRREACACASPRTGQ